MSPISETIPKPVYSNLTTLWHTGSAIIAEITALIACMWNYNSGKTKNYKLYSTNPEKITLEEAKKPAILFLHGDHHNQSAVTSLAYKVEQYRKTSSLGPLFTVNLEYDEVHPEKHRERLTDRIDQIKKLYEEHGQPFKLSLVGHSKGAIEAANYVYLTPHADVQVEKIISLAGRLKVVDSSLRGCHPSLQPLVNAVDQAIKKNPNIPLHTIVADKDWIMHPDSAFISSEKSIIFPKLSHVSVLRDDAVLDQVIRWLS